MSRTKGKRQGKREFSQGGPPVLSCPVPYCPVSTAYQRVLFGLWAPWAAEKGNT